MTLGDRLSARRKKLRLTNGQVATYLGISKAHVSDLEHDKANPSVDLLMRIAKYYKTTAGWLLEGMENSEAGENRNQEWQNEALVILEELPLEYREMIVKQAEMFRDLERHSQERTLGQFVYRMLGDLKEQYGEEAIEELTRAVDLFARTGDDSALRAWFQRYFGLGGL